MAILLFIITVLKKLFPNILDKWGFNISRNKIEVDQSLPNFFHAIQRNQEKILAETKYYSDKYNFDILNQSVLDKLTNVMVGEDESNVKIPQLMNRKSNVTQLNGSDFKVSITKVRKNKKVITNIAWYSMIENMRYMREFNYFPASMANRNSYIVDDDSDEDNNCEQSDIVIILLNLAYMDRQQALDFNFAEGYSKSQWRIMERKISIFQIYKFTN